MYLALFAYRLRRTGPGNRRVPSTTCDARAGPVFHTSPSKEGLKRRPPVMKLAPCLSCTEWRPGSAVLACNRLGRNRTRGLSMGELIVKHQRFVEMVVMAAVAFGLSACGGGSGSPGSFSGSGTSTGTGQSGGGSGSGESSGGGGESSPPPATGPSLMALATGDSKLDLFDPTQPVAAGTNPVSVDSGMSSGSVLGLFPSYTGTISSGAVTGIQGVRLAYVKNGVAYTVNTVVGDSHAPVQVSDLSGICGIGGYYSPEAGDGLGGWMLVTVPQPGGQCSGPQAAYMVQMSTPSSGSAVAVPNDVSAVMSTFDPDTGLISGFLDAKLNPDDSVTQELRDANFANPKTVETSAPGSAVQVDQAGATQIYLAYIPSGQTAAQLFSLNTATGALTGPLYTFANGVPTWNYAGFHEDAANFYFIDGNDLVQIPRNATGTGQTVTLAALVPPGDTPDVTALDVTQKRVVVVLNSGTPVNPSYTAVSAAIGVASSGAPTLLAEGLTSVPFVAASGEVYYTNGAGASVVQDDGTPGASMGAGTQWVGDTLVDSLPDLQTTLGADLATVELGTPPDGSGNESVVAYDASTAKAGNTLGQVPVAASVSSFGVRSGYLGIEAASPGQTSLSSYVADSQTANSIALVSNAGPDNNMFVGY